ncbi:MAG: hypothetical protein ACRC1R_02995 [Cetobacterium sp.]|uniref:hypothetical protein n=1 Tax=Cetobacterium sp. TaxID=2071632 RepID=UPI003F2CC2B6
MSKIIVLFFAIFFLSFGKDINIGDQLQLHIKGIEKDEVVNKFHDFKIKDIKSNKNEVDIIITSYNPGKHEVLLGNKNIIIDVKPLTTKEDMKILTDFNKNEEKFILKDYPYLGILFLIVGSFIFIISLIWIYIEYHKNPKFIFKKSMKKINEENWREICSYSIREYIDNIYGTHFLQGDYKEIGVLTEDDLKTIKNLDYLKYSPNKSEDREKYQREVYKIYKRIGDDKNV